MEVVVLPVPSLIGPVSAPPLPLPVLVRASSVAYGEKDLVQAIADLIQKGSGLLAVGGTANQRSVLRTLLSCAALIDSCFKASWICPGNSFYDTLRRASSLELELNPYNFASIDEVMSMVVKYLLPGHVLLAASGVSERNACSDQVNVQLAAGISESRICIIVRSEDYYPTSSEYIRLIRFLCLQVAADSLSSIMIPCTDTHSQQIFITELGCNHMIREVGNEIEFMQVEILSCNGSEFNLEPPTHVYVLAGQSNMSGRDMELTKEMCNRMAHLNMPYLDETLQDIILLQESQKEFTTYFDAEISAFVPLRYLSI